MHNGARRKKTPLVGHELDLRQFVRHRSLDGEIGVAIVDFYKMVIAISSKGFDAASQDLIRGLDTARPATEVIAVIAEHLTRNISGLKADILRKAIQETLLDAAGLGYGPEPLNVKAGLEKFLGKRGTKKILELLLSSYVFNTIWIRIQDAVRTKKGSRSLTKSMLSIERFCVSLVKSVLEEWEANGKLEELTTKTRLGSELVKTIQTRLVEDSARP